MKHILIITFLCLCSQLAGAQEKAINVVKTDGTSLQTRVADLKQISFLTVDEGGEGLLLRTVSGDTAAVLFEARPIVTIADGRLSISSSAAEPITVEIDNIQEITFGQPDPAAIDRPTRDFSLTLQDGAALLRGIPEGLLPRVYSADGRLVATPTPTNGTLTLSRATLGTGLFVVKIGKTAAKIHL